MHLVVGYYIFKTYFFSFSAEISLYWIYLLFLIEVNTLLTSALFRVFNSMPYFIHSKAMHASFASLAGRNLILKRRKDINIGHAHVQRIDSARGLSHDHLLLLKGTSGFFFFLSVFSHYLSDFVVFSPFCA